MTTPTDRIARWLAFCGISRDQLAAAIGVNPDLFRVYLTLCHIPENRVAAICAHLDTTPDWLVHGLGEPPCWWPVRR